MTPYSKSWKKFILSSKRKYFYSLRKRFIFLIYFPYIYIICAQSRNWTKDFVKLKLKEDQIFYEESDTRHEGGKDTQEYKCVICVGMQGIHTSACVRV